MEQICKTFFQRDSRKTAFVANIKSEFEYLGTQFGVTVVLFLLGPFEFLLLVLSIFHFSMGNARSLCPSIVAALVSALEVLVVLGSNRVLPGLGPQPRGSSRLSHYVFARTLNRPFIAESLDYLFEPVGSHEYIG